MSVSGFPIATLILPDQNGLDPAPYLDDIGALVARQDGGPVRLVRDRVIGATHVVVVTADPDGDFGPCVEIAVLSHDGIPADDEQALPLLSRIVMAASLHSPFDLIAWTEGGDLKEREEILSDLRRQGYSRATLRGELHELRDSLNAVPEARAETETTSAPILADPTTLSADKSRLSAAGWLMTGLLSLISLPMAAALGIVGLVRGMEFRLATQVVSLTVLFVALSNTQTLNRLVYMVIH